MLVWSGLSVVLPSEQIKKCVDLLPCTLEAFLLRHTLCCVVLRIDDPWSTVERNLSLGSDYLALTH